ncbi:MAG: NTP transferase domain-containing protein [Candidatus Heimdallarchaeota archaeon]|nr:MAG: NTP transferase domain-containing protein [Candidatus Heimdallarchaeota archaeon]
MNNVIFILLAGGEASRYRNSFKSLTNGHHDKLLSRKGDLSLLEFVCAELKPLGDVIVVTRGEMRKQGYLKLLEKNNLMVISEDIEKSIGPIGGIHSALKFCKKDQIKFILPADLPNIRRDIIAELITRSSQSKHFDLISLVHPNGQLENLVLISHGDVLSKGSQVLIDRGIFRVSSLIRLILKKRFLNSAYLIKGTQSSTFVDLDFYESKSKINTFTNPVLISPFIDFGLDTEIKQKDPTILYHQSLDLITNSKTKHQNRIQAKIILLLEESNIYKKKGLLSLSLHCLLDVYKITKDLEIKNQINSLMMQLEASGRDIQS